MALSEESLSSSVLSGFESVFLHTRLATFHSILANSGNMNMAAVIKKVIHEASLKSISTLNPYFSSDSIFRFQARIRNLQTDQTIIISNTKQPIATKNKNMNKHLKHSSFLFNFIKHTLRLHIAAPKVKTLAMKSVPSAIPSNAQLFESFFGKLSISN